MGLFGGSSKSTTVQHTTTRITDRRVAATDQALVATDGGRIEIDNTDPEFLEAALGRLLSFASDESARNRSAFDATVGLIESSQQSTEGLVENVLEKSRTEGAETFNRLVQALMWVGIAAAAAWALRKARAR